MKCINKRKKMSCKVEKTTNIIKGFAVGLMLGNAIGNLFASKTGKENRKDYLNKCKRAKDSTLNLFDDTNEKIIRVYSDLEEKMIRKDLNLDEDA